MNNIGYQNVEITGGYWKEKQDLNKAVTINKVYDRFYETGRIDAFKCNWIEGMDEDKKPHIYWDSDVAKWIEGAAYILSKDEDAELWKKVDGIISDIEKNQCDDGYFNIYFTVCEPENRFKMRQNHELYCAGHLVEAGIALSEGLGDNRLLECMKKYLLYIKNVFIDEKSAEFDTPGHAELELALLRLYQYTNNKEYLDMAMYFIDTKGRSEKDRRKEHHVAKEQQMSDKEQLFRLMIGQDHLPLREQRTAEGHSVRAAYIYTAMAHAAYVTGDSKLLNACKAIFNNITDKKMYITGGIGQTMSNEGFTSSYDLPNRLAYAETCASIGMMFFADKMLLSDCSSVYGDIIEKEMYNGMISGLSINGEKFFYTNPLEIDLKTNNRYKTGYPGVEKRLTERVGVFWCSCCPPNLNRVIASIGKYIYGYEDDTIYVNQFIESDAEINGMKISQRTKYPANGMVEIQCKNINTLCIRIPSWCDNFNINCDYSVENGYAVIKNPQKSVLVNFEMNVMLIEANANVFENAGKVAVMYGPVVYCAEGIDNCNSIGDLYILEKNSPKVTYDEYFKLNTLEVDGIRKLSGNSLYNHVNNNFEKCKIKMIPYNSFANRGETDMRVWMNFLCKHE